VIGYELAARAQGDGHTLLVVFPEFRHQSGGQAGLKYDPSKDFKAWVRRSRLPMVLRVNPSPYRRIPFRS